MPIGHGSYAGPSAPVLELAPELELSPVLESSDVDASLEPEVLPGPSVVASAVVPSSLVVVPSLVVDVSVVGQSQAAKPWPSSAHASIPANPPGHTHARVSPGSHEVAFDVLSPPSLVPPFRSEPSAKHDTHIRASPAIHQRTIMSEM